jgi:D-alanine-D-alanine ligase
MKVLLLFGGRSAEHEVSEVSAGFVGGVLEESGHVTIRVRIGTDGSWYFEGEQLFMEIGRPVWKLLSGEIELEFDVVFPVLHGPYGEDGTLQGLCMMAGWPFAGADVMSSSAAMNKITAKELASSRAIPVLPWKSFSRWDPPGEPDVADLGYPLFVKPARMGSSVGVSRVDSPNDLGIAIDKAFSYDSLILVEKGLDRAREIEVALLSAGGTVESSIPGEIVPGLTWYDYAAKYRDAGSRLLIPAQLSDDETSAVRRMAEESFGMLFGSGFARADFLLSRDGKFFFNEINTIPGFTEISMFPKLWRASGREPAEVMETILQEALRRHAETSENMTGVPV